MITTLCLVIGFILITSTNTVSAQSVYTNPVDYYNENSLNSDELYTINNYYSNKLSLQSYNYYIAPYYNKYRLNNTPNIISADDKYRYLYLLSKWQNQNFDYTYNRNTLKYNGQYVDILSPNQLLDLKEGVCRDFATFTASQLLKNGYPVYFIYMIYDDKNSHLFVATEINEGGNSQLLAVDKGSDVDYLASYLQKISKPGVDNVVKVMRLTENEEFGTYEFNYEYNISKLNVQKPSKSDLIELNNSLAKKLANNGYNIINLSNMADMGNTTKLQYSYGDILHKFPDYYIDDITMSHVVLANKNKGNYSLNTYWDIKTNKTSIDLYITA
ncbi:transglutaminase-like domain-containing protein [Methanococcus voltae]|uniref:transglutaminase-like domain-containing protein n=1 Tax=Methanococcus voltae TaxID=2188 RepID=UPI001AE7E1CF|nr:transglutaminase-like domain-containing protein [Methanococcus voltae]